MTLYFDLLTDPFESFLVGDTFNPNQEDNEPMTTYTYEDSAYVQHFLNELGTGQPFTVIFMTQKDEQRMYTGTLAPSDNRSQSVAMMTEQGYKKFSVDRVLSIQDV